jgi:hypothetical protein
MVYENYCGPHLTKAFLYKHISCFPLEKEAELLDKIQNTCQFVVNETELFCALYGTYNNWCKKLYRMGDIFEYIYEGYNVLLEFSKIDKATNKVLRFYVKYQLESKETLLNDPYLMPPNQLMDELSYQMGNMGL